jgi:hypothetical protein
MEELTTERIHELCKWKWYNYIKYYCFYIWWNFLTDLKWKIPNIIQRAYRGWGDADTWDFDGYLSKIISEGCKHLKLYKHGIPGDIYDKYRNDVLLDQNEAEFLAIKEWNEILDKIILAFDLIKQIQYDGKREFYLPDLPEALKNKYNCLSKEEDDAMNEGMHLFIKYFFSLWD